MDPDKKLEIVKLNKVSGDIKLFACGLSHLMMVKKDDTVFGCGCNDDGNCGFRLGKGKSHVPTQADYDYGKVSDIKSGGGHNLLLTTDGKIFTSGSNSFGQLGLGDRNNRFKFCEVPIDKDILGHDIKQGEVTDRKHVDKASHLKGDSTGFKVKGIACGAFHSLIYMKDSKGEKMDKVFMVGNCLAFEK